MNQCKDFHKKEDGVVVNVNSKDYLRARNRNFVRKEQVKIIGEDGKVAVLERELADLKSIINELVKINRNNRRI